MKYRDMYRIVTQVSRYVVISGIVPPLVITQFWKMIAPLSLFLTSTVKRIVTAK